jgi:hypothetical protein
MSICESLESRTLLSSVLAPAKAELAILATDAGTLKTDIRTGLTHLKAGVPAGTAGRKALVSAIKLFRTDATTFGAALTTDFDNLKTAVNADSGDATALLNTLIGEATTAKTTLKSDATSIGDVIAKHPAFATDDTHLTADSAAIKAAGTKVDDDLKTLKADLTGITV